MTSAHDTVCSDPWAEGPRPSFFGQLRKGASDESASSRSHDTRPLELETDAVSDRGAGWAEPLVEAKSPPDAIDHRRQAFVRQQLAQAFAVDHWQRRLISLAITLLIGAICWYGDAPLAGLLAWVGARLVLSWAWTMTMKIGSATPRARPRLSAPRRMVVVAALTGAVLGASVLLFFGRISIGLQFMCWIVLAGASTLPLPTMALDAVRIRAYTHATFSVMVACILFRIATADPHLATDVLDRHYEAWFLVMPLAQWLLVRRVADQVFSHARSGYELDFYKHELIRTLEEKRRQAEEAVQTKNRFIATAAHDVRQPVVALSIYVDHLREVPSDQPAVLPKIAKAVAAVNRLFDSLFDLARMDNQQLKVQVEPLNISEVMDDLRDQYEPIAEARDIVLRVRTARIDLQTDPVLIRRMIGNVVSNAIKYTPPGKKVLLSVRARKHAVRVEVWDQGVGMAPHELRKVFQEFYKIPDAPENTEGFGLGLSIVARLAHVLDTRLSVRSRPGKGTVFRMDIGSLADPGQA
jgi:signal transduction histidine kinase